MMDRFEIGDWVICIKEYESLREGSGYTIKGSGDLTMNAGTDKVGYGFLIEHEISELYTLPYSQRVKSYYFTEREMNEYFITLEDYRVCEDRDKKLKEIGI